MVPLILKTTMCCMMQTHVNSLILEHSVTVPEHTTQAPFSHNTKPFYLLTKQRKFRTFSKPECEVTRTKDGVFSTSWQKYIFFCLFNWSSYTAVTLDVIGWAFVYPP